ncbi:hypothetical protein SRHO_G00281770 [Serrasalmus rhombeus]
MFDKLMELPFKASSRPCDFGFKMLWKLNGHLNRCSWETVIWVLLYYSSELGLKTCFLQYYERGVCLGLRQSAIVVRRFPDNLVS